MSYHFKRLQESDLDRLCGWLDKPHVKQWWDDDLNHEAIKQKYRERLKSKDVCPYVVYEHEIPFGFIQYYWASRMLSTAIEN